MENVVILGTGPAGLAAAIYLAQAGYKPLIFESAPVSSDSDKPVPVGSTHARMRAQAIRIGVRFRAGRAALMPGTPFRIKLESGTPLASRAIIIADGELVHDMDILGGYPQEEPGQAAFAGGDGFFIQGHQLFVGGSGDDDSQDALFLTRFASEARLVQRRMQQRAYANPSTRWAIDMTPIEVIPGELGLHGLKVRMTADSMHLPSTLSGSSPQSGPLSGGMPVEIRSAFIESGILSKATGTPACKPGIFVCRGNLSSGDIHPLQAAAAGCLAAIRCEHFLDIKAAAV
ncbi:NAD(P)/FAD-dependent oxidoreductase [Paenibacillus xanthanilyticus]|uniref:NAD(P)/FAD-dependent oxidoreductase n=1 Tax=Paenibacillus xanthanilyticus TaxID=1783531 RepID=A0ABV8JVK5_9BACL